MDFAKLSDFLPIVFGFLLIVVLVALLLKRETVIKFLEILSIQIKRPSDQTEDSPKQASTETEPQTTRGKSIRVKVRDSANVGGLHIESKTTQEPATMDIDAAGNTKTKDITIKISDKGDK